MIFEEWVDAQPPQIRRDLHENLWVRSLCREAFAMGKVDTQDRIVELIHSWDETDNVGYRSTDLGQWLDGNYSSEAKYVLDPEKLVKAIQEGRTL